MPSHQRPFAGRRPHDFNPADLARSVIALPLLEELEQEQAAIDRIEEIHPGLRKRYNAALFLDQDYPGSIPAALAAVRKLLAQVSRTLDNPKPPPSVADPDPGIAPDVALARLDGDAMHLLQRLDARQAHPAIVRAWPSQFEVIIDINLNFKRPADSRNPAGQPSPPDARPAAKELIKKYIARAQRDSSGQGGGIDEYKTGVSNQYVFARLTGQAIKALVEIDRREAEGLARRANTRPPGRKGRSAPGTADAASNIGAASCRTIFHIWPDSELRNCVTQSISTVKVDAARRSFMATGEGITWAVMDTGIDSLHPHFKLHGNIDAASPYHADFTGSPGGPKPLQDDFGHGTHVAGIIAGEQSLDAKSDPKDMVSVWHELDADGQPVARTSTLATVSGMAPKCRLISLKVLDEFGIGKASNVIAAIAHVQALNGHGRDLKIHGVNLSLGHPFDPKWFACGHSPLCTEVNRLVKSGVVVVVAAGNTGYGSLQTKEGASDACLDLTINDPGNAEYAITVGSTHREMPHMYGVSYFSSKGPTGDGRRKPDLLAPGEKIISCAARNCSLVQNEANDEACSYFENSGTSMAAPHVSGAVAAFLSVRREFKGETEKIKEIFTSTATDLGRDRDFQGAGLLDLMRAIQSV